MTKLIDWIKQHKLSSFLILIILFFLWNLASSNRTQSVSRSAGSSGMMQFGALDSYEAEPSAVGKTAMMGTVVNPSYAPPADTANRMVTTDTSLSLKVDDVSQSISRIESIANQAGGYMVDSNLSKPEGAANGTISLRVPTEKRGDVLSALRGLAVKVVSENVTGQDITDQYVDNDERLRILQSTKVKFESILADAKNVQDMLQVQRELLNLQNQIDSIKGQQKYLEGSAKLSRVTIFLSTDELALPYAPDTTWRPTLVFKEAVRSLVFTLRQVGSLAIWAAVYAPVALVMIALIWVIRKVTTKR